MSNRTTYEPGTFSWVDLSTPDQPAAKTFYTELFGWQGDDQPVGDGAVYSMMRLDGADVAAISPQPEQQRNVGAPPTWNSYITVESADQTLGRASELGGTVHAPAFDVLDVGRMGVVQDPHGAFFMVWEPKLHIGASLVNAPGAMTWNELASPDVERSVDFYGQLFGWTAERMPTDEMDYRVIRRADGGTNGGIRAAMEGEPPHWLVYFGTDDLDASLATATGAGATNMAGPIEMAGGRFAVLQDPGGAIFALWGGEFDG
jgi:predicted enzyme related to lactoylglutathione lyase